MSDLDAVRRLAGPTAAAIEAQPPADRRPERLSRPRRGHRHEPRPSPCGRWSRRWRRSRSTTGERLAHEIARAALMGARGQLGRDPLADRPRLRRRRSAARRRSTRRRSRARSARRATPPTAPSAEPVEGTMLTVDPRAGRGGRGAGAGRRLGRRPPARARPPRRGRRSRARRSTSRSSARPASSMRAARACSSSSAGSTAARHRRGAAGASGRARGGRLRRRPPGALAIPLLHGLRRRGRGPRPGRARSARSSRSATR